MERSDLLPSTASGVERTTSMIREVRGLLSERESIPPESVERSPAFSNRQRPFPGPRAEHWQSQRNERNVASGPRPVGFLAPDR
jgi:hypothetical protein